LTFQFSQLDFWLKPHPHSVQ